MKSMVALGILLNIVILSALIYVAVHFIGKVW